MWEKMKCDKRLAKEKWRWKKKKSIEIMICNREKSTTI